MIDGVIQVLAGGLVALAGTFVGPFFQRKHEKWRADRDDRAILRNKAEELFDELDQFVAKSQAASVAAVAKMQDDTIQAKHVPDLGRVRAIAAIYFPTALPLIDAFETENLELIKWVGTQTEAALKDGDAGISVLKSLPMVLALKHQQRGSKFVSDLRKHLADNVPKMELEKS